MNKEESSKRYDLGEARSKKPVRAILRTSFFFFFPSKMAFMQKSVTI